MVRLNLLEEDELKFKHKTLVVTRAPPAGDIMYQNFRFSYTQRMWKRTKSNLVAILIVVLGFLVLNLIGKF